MSSAQLDIVITEAKGGSPVGKPVGDIPGSDSPTSSPSSNSPSSGKDKEDKGTPLADAAHMLARVLGLGGLASAAELLIRAFKELQKRVDDTDPNKPPPEKPATPEPHPGSPESPPEKPKAPDDLEPVNPVGMPAPAGAEATEGVEAVTAGAGVVAGGIAAIAAFAAPVILATAAVSMLGFAAKKVADALQADAEHLAEFSEKISVAVAQADLRQQYAEIDRSQRLEGKLSEFEEVYTKLQTDSYKVWTVIEEVVLEVITPILQEIEPTIKIAVDLLRIVADGIAETNALSSGQFLDGIKIAMKGKDDIAKLIEDLLGQNNDDVLDDPFTVGIFGPGFSGGAPGGAAGVGGVGPGNVPGWVWKAIPGGNILKGAADLMGGI